MIEGMGMYEMSSGDQGIPEPKEVLLKIPLFWYTMSRVSFNAFKHDICLQNNYLDHRLHNSQFNKMFK